MRLPVTKAKEDNSGSGDLTPCIAWKASLDAARADYKDRECIMLGRNCGLLQKSSMSTSPICDNLLPTTYLPQSFANCVRLCPPFPVHFPRSSLLMWTTQVLLDVPIALRYLHQQSASCSSLLRFCVVLFRHSLPSRQLRTASSQMMAISCRCDHQTSTLTHTVHLHLV
jgi:hypothetical protein